MPAPADRPPTWVADAVFYQIFPDRFARSGRVNQPEHLEPWDEPPSVHGYKGGDLLGIVDHLDWIQELGATALYLNPIFQSPSNHRYHTHDYFRVDPLLGSDAEFETLVDACHARGLRVILDGVFNHASRGFFQFNDILESGDKSPWTDWFKIDSYPVRAYDHSVPPNYDAWWGLHALPKFNTENRQVREFLMRAAEHWTARGIDGWRLDVPLEIKTEGFWEEFRRRVRAINPDAYIVAEIWEEATEWVAGGDRFDAAMNYPLTGAVVSFAGVHRIDWDVADRLDYAVRDIDAAGYAAAVQHLLDTYPPHTTQASLNLLGSHDTARVRSVMGGDPVAVVLAMALVMTFPGAPCIYYGDEIGLLGGHDPECRAAFPWTHEDGWNTEILESVRSLTRLRHEHPVLRHGDYTTLVAQPGSLLYVFERRDPSARMVIGVNMGETAASAQPAGMDRAERVWGTGELRKHGPTIELRLPPRSAGVWLAG